MKLNHVEPKDDSIVDFDLKAALEKIPCYKLLSCVK